MKRWVSKLIDQFDLDMNHASKENMSVEPMSDDRATLLYIIDTFNKHLLEMDAHPVRKTRETLDEFAKELLDTSNQNTDRILFKFRQFFTSYRIDEYSYIQKTFDEFRGIIWDFVDQLSEDLSWEKVGDREIQHNLEVLKDAVESNSIDDLKNQSRHFIDSYIEFQSRKDERKTHRLDNVRKNLSAVKKKLVEANHNLNRDHLTGAYNRKSFDEKIYEYQRIFKLSQAPVSLVMLDIDHFKKFNDTYGHAIGDFILVECVKLLQDNFCREADFVARVGGEEFAIILPDYKVEHAVKKVEEAMGKIRKDIFVQDNHELRFTVSMGIAELAPEESVSEWMKRSDEALYEAKNSGRNRYVIAPAKVRKITAA